MGGLDEEVRVNPSVMFTQAKEVVQSPLNLLEEIITNSSDSLFGTRFTEFFSLLVAPHRVPAIPTLDEYDKWREVNKYGNITITIDRKYAKIRDDASGIPFDFVESRFLMYSRGRDDQIECSNNPDFHRRGQFSRGLKEAAIALNSNLRKGDRTDGVLQVDTVYKEGIQKFRWRGEYYLADNKIKFRTLQEKTETTDDTGTTIQVIYPSDSEDLIPRTKIFHQLQDNLKMQRIIREHNVTLKLSRSLRILTPYLDRVDSKIIKSENFRIAIPKDGEQTIYSRMRELLDDDFVEVKIELLELQSSEPLKEYRNSSQVIPTADMRGIILGDHTTIYGMIDIDNTLGSEFLQMYVTIPALRVFAVQGVISGSSMESLVSSNRKSLNLRHPLFKLVQDKIMQVWNEEVEKRAAQIRNEEKKRVDKRVTAMNSKLENKLNKILEKFMEELEEDVPPGGASGEGGDSEGGVPPTGTPGNPRPKSFFGPQNTAYGLHLIIKPGRIRRIKIFVHEDLISSRQEYLSLSADGDILYDTSLETLTNALDVFFDRDVKKQGALYVFEVFLKSAWELDPGTQYTIELSMKTKGNDLLNDPDYLPHLIEKYIDYKIPSGLSIKPEGNDVIISTPVAITIGSERDRGDTGGLVDIKWQTDDEVTIGPDRKEKQSKLTTGWSATPSYNLIDGEQHTSYIIQVFLKSRFFAKSFDDRNEITDQDEQCKTLMAMAVCSGLAEIMVTAKLLSNQDIDQLSSYREYINANFKDILGIISSEIWMK